MSEKILVSSEQEERIPEYRAKWKEIGLNTDPLDLPTAIAGAKLLYAQAHKPFPQYIYTAMSPWHGLFMQVQLHLLLEKKAKLLPTQAELVASLASLAKEDIKKHGKALLNQSLYGSQDAFWLAFYNFFQEVINVEDCNKLQGLFDIARSCGWWIPHEQYIIFQDRPTSIKLDDQNRMHNPTGPAITYVDGDAIYVWHGTRVPAHWINNCTLTAQEALAVTNTDERLAACEILGWDKILQDLEAIEIDRHPNPQVGVLVEVNIPVLGRTRFIRVCETIDGKGRMFALGVDLKCTTALEANLSTFNLPTEEALIPVIRV